MCVLVQKLKTVRQNLMCRKTYVPGKSGFQSLMFAALGVIMISACALGTSELLS